MDQIYVQRWASSLRQFRRNHYQNINHCQLATAVTSSPSTNNNSTRTLSHQYFAPTSSEFDTVNNESFILPSRAPPIVTDVCVGSHNGGRNVRTTTKTRESEPPHDNQKYSFTLNFAAPKKVPNHTLKSFYTFDMTTKAEKNLHSPPDNHTSNLLTPSSDYHDIDTLSDAGTYVIEDDLDVAQDDKSEQKSKPSSSFKRYTNQTKNRHGTFDIHGLVSSTAHTIHRPVVDSNIPTHDSPSPSPSLSNSSSLSSLLSFPDENNHNIHEDPTIKLSNTLLPQKQIKSAECFVISPAHESKAFPITNTSRRKVDVPLQSKITTKSVGTKDSNLEGSSPRSTRPDQNSTEKYSFNLPSNKASIRPHSAINDQTYSSSTFQRNSTVRQTIPGNSPYQRPTSTSSTINSDNHNESTSKVPMNKSFLLRQQHSNHSPSTTKSSARQPLKPTISITNSNGQMNRAVELRRARAQAKIEELSQRTKHSSNKNDIMSASWHSSASKKDISNLRANPRTTAKTNVAHQQRDIFETPSRYRKTKISSVTDEPNTRLSASSFSIEGERCDSLRDNGQRLAIKLIQLSSGILEKLKPNDGVVDNDVSVRELEQLVDKLQTVNRTLSLIDASLIGPTNDDAFV